ncbi:MAG: hypothetical protein Q7U78_09745 [Gallionella sp.]|nr:hypothetical protein [Gallionella sp.]
MNKQNHLQLLAEKSSLERMLSATPEEDVLDRGSLLARLEEVAHKIEATMQDKYQPARAKLTFNGRPVIGTHGIFADFGMKAVNSFTEAVAAVAASLTAPLASMGPIPNRNQNQMLITNTALGSFGFELEEYVEGRLQLDEQTAVALALEKTLNLLQGSVEQDDELLADSAAELGPRVLDKVRAFVKTLAENEAICALQIQAKAFRFNDIGQVRRSLERISQDNLREEDKILIGNFEGALPTRRTFEFKLRDSGEVITGKISSAVSNPEKINAHLYQQLNIQVMETRVGHNGRPRYLLLETPQWSPANESHS